MKEKPVLPLLVSMALPNVISMLVNSLYNIVDSLFVARISEDAMTALSLVFPIQNFANAIAIGFGIGINAMIALYLGAGDHKKAETAATHGMALSLMHGILITIVSIVIMPGFLRRFTSDTGLIASGITYSTIVFLFATINMTGIRMNLSHGPLAAHTDWLAMIRAAGIRQLLIDLQGPELRIGTLAEPVALVEGSSVRLGADGVPCPAALVQAAAPGQQLLLDDGKLLVQVTQVLPEALVCTVVRGGTLQSRKSIAAPGLAVPSPTLTEEDLQNLKIAKQCGVTGVMLPFVRGKADILALRHALEEAGAADIRIFAKIENMTGVRALPEFIHLVDEVVIARGDLGNAMPLWELPRCQKQLSAACRAAGVPFMVVTQMLDSMCTRAVPTRAEVSDIYNAVLDGAASVMLTGETAAGQYPMQAMEYLVRTAQTALA